MLRTQSCALATICLGVIAAGCETTQDLGAHADGGAAAVEAGTAPRAGGAIFFVTEDRYPADLGGPAGADEICMNEAKSAGLAGGFRAWLSSSTENAKDRIAPVGPWRMVNDDQVFAGPAVSGAPEVFPTFTATGTNLFFDLEVAVWTGTKENGRLSEGNACSDWTTTAASARGSFGNLNMLQGWTEDFDLQQRPELLPCSARARLYCFGQ